jgi:transcriptional regulator with XRE-family HTH domain
MTTSVIIVVSKSLFVEYDGFVLTMNNLAYNLRWLCSYSGSISHSCRELQINRRQFARYISGQSAPSAHNLRKISDYFGVTVEAFSLPPEQFRTLLKKNVNTLRFRAEQLISDLKLPACDNLPLAENSLGMYHSYLRSIEYPGGIIRSAVMLTRTENRLLTKSIERIRPLHSSSRRAETYKLVGEWVQRGDKVFIVEAEYLQGNAIVESILHLPTDHKTEHLIFGYTLGLSSGASRKPYFSPTVYQPVSKDTPLRKFMRNCALYPEHSDAIDPRIRKFLELQIDPSVNKTPE